MRRSPVLCGGLAAAALAPALLGLAAGTQEPVVFSAKEIERIERLSPLGPPPPDPTNRVADDPRAAALGQYLFFDPGLSVNGEVSCATCHDPELGFGDGKPVAETLGVGTRRTPSVLNAAHLRWLFWDGRADSLWAQALEPIENPIEMGSSRVAAANHVFRAPELRAAYEALFGPLPELDDETRFPRDARPMPRETDPAGRAWAAMSAADREAIDHVYANLGKAIAAYERRLLSIDAPFDRFVEGLREGDPEKRRALSPAAQRGLRLFVGRGRCTLCHNGPAFTDSEFHNTSTPPRDGGELADPGRYDGAARVVANPFNAAGAYSDDTHSPAADRVRRLRQTSESWGEFRTPGLRGVAERGPFMHQGQFATLTEVLGFYSTLEDAAARNHHQEQILVPLRLTGGEIQDLLAFLASLTGAPLEGALLSAPAGPTLTPR